MGSDRKILLGSTSDAEKAQKQVNAAEKGIDLSSAQRPNLQPRSSLESTATTLPCYGEQPDRPPAYSGTGTYSGQRNAKSASASRSSDEANAAAIRAVMATSGSNTDKMHTRRPKKVDNWNEDPTYKGKLASRSGSKGNWNYFGADIEQYGNPFKRFGRKK